MVGNALQQLSLLFERSVLQGVWSGDEGAAHEVRRLLHTVVGRDRFINFTTLLYMSSTGPTTSVYQVRAAISSRYHRNSVENHYAPGYLTSVYLVTRLN